MRRSKGEAAGLCEGGRTISLTSLALATLLAASPAVTQITGADLARLQVNFPPGGPWNVTNALVREVKSLRLDGTREVVVVYYTDPAPDYDRHSSVTMALLDTSTVPARRLWITNLSDGSMLSGESYEHHLALRTDLPRFDKVVEVRAIDRGVRTPRVSLSLYRFSADQPEPLAAVFSTSEFVDLERGERSGLATSVRARPSPKGAPTELIAVTGLQRPDGGRARDGEQRRTLYRLEGQRWQRFTPIGPETTWTVTASSTLAPSGLEDYEPMRAFDGDSSTAWCKAADRPAEGQWLAIRLGAEAVVSAVIVTPGVARSEALFQANDRPALLRITWPGGVVDETLDDSPKPRRIALPSKTRLQELRIELVAVWPGARFHDACISEVELEMVR